MPSYVRNADVPDIAFEAEEARGHAIAHRAADRYKDD
jgi:hypothetical protein